jgi:hypothetical protein
MVLNITTEYIGPSSKAFLDRQTRAHMGGLDFNDLQKANLPELAKWVNTSAGLLIGKDKAKELSDRISKL